MVEGDEIATEGGGRLELQLGRTSHVRIAENARVRFAVLRDEGVALSVSQGVAVIRLTEFEKARSYFEIDAPETTVSIQKAGRYRIDAGVSASDRVVVAVSEFGEARVYSADSGFTLKNGRSATLATKGALSGEWEIADAEKFADEFDAWTLERDALVAKSLQDAYFDKYYDDDIYGAEDLNTYGQWVHTRKYGYVWKPYATATASYSDWAPYRYGQWRWLPPFGWTWVNDEPWGWATYHHGRWLYDSGFWYWAPYGYYRHTRSWWQPALVVINIYGGNVCWYPLPYYVAYYNYNHHWQHHHQHSGGGGGNNGGNTGGSGTPNPAETTGAKIRRPGFPGSPHPDAGVEMPFEGVTTMPVDVFGTGDVRGARPNRAVARSVLIAEPATTPILPTLDEVEKQKVVAIRAPSPRAARQEVAVGAATRRPDAALDEELRRTRTFGGRQPVAPPAADAGPRVPRTGAVEREPVRAAPVRDQPTPPIRVPPTSRINSDPIRTAPAEPIRVPPPEPVRAPRSREAEPIRQPPPDPVRVPRSQPPPVREQPKPPPAAKPAPAPVKEAPRDGDSRSKDGKS
jgi:hypothetical protein